MDRIRKVIHLGKEVVVVDYSDLKESAMVELVDQAKAFILKEQKQELLIVSVFNEKNFVTPAFMRHLEAELKTVEPLVLKNCVTGLSQTQLWILKGINLWYKKQIHPFGSLQEAMDYAVA